MRKLLILILMLFSTPLYAGEGGGVISATSTEADTALGGKHVILVNDGPNEVYIRLRQEGAANLNATTSDFSIANGDSATFDSEEGFSQVSTICQASETASLRYVYWD